MLLWLCSAGSFHPRKREHFTDAVSSVLPISLWCPCTSTGEGTEAQWHGRGPHGHHSGRKRGEPRTEPPSHECRFWGPCLLFRGGEYDFIIIEVLYSQWDSLANLLWWSVSCRWSLCLRADPLASSQSALGLKLVCSVSQTQPHSFCLGEKCGPASFWVRSWDPGTVLSRERTEPCDGQHRFISSRFCAENV